MTQRIVSLVPSLTELVWWLGRGDALVGRTRFCTEPPELAGTVPAVGGTKNPRLDRIVALRPDLVLANKEENRQEDVGALIDAGLDVLLTDPNTVDEAVAMILEVGEWVGATERAEQLAADVNAALEEGRARAVRVFVAVWKKPLMGLGSETYGHDLLERVGATNVLAGRRRYPEVTMEALAGLAPQAVLLPDEPYPFKEPDCADFVAVAPARVVDGKLLWWYGPRMPAAIRELRKVLGEFEPGD
ncbi:MAG TPA: helical backbone metal receptor [Tepidiformaceae bacterium]